MLWPSSGKAVHQNNREHCYRSMIEEMSLSCNCLNSILILAYNFTVYVHTLHFMNAKLSCTVYMYLRIPTIWHIIEISTALYKADSTVVLGLNLLFEVLKTYV